MNEDGRVRVVIEGVAPEIDCGRYPAKRIAGEKMTVQADIFSDGHDELDARLLYRRDGDDSWSESPMERIGNDRWEGSFPLPFAGSYHYTVAAWVDHFRTWQKELVKRVAAGQDPAPELVIGVKHLEHALEHGSGDAVVRLRTLIGEVKGLSDPAAAFRRATTEEAAAIYDACSGRAHAARYGRELSVTVDRKRALFSTWYEFFPRSTSPEGGHGTFQQASQRLPEIAAMGFDVVYFPPIHPIGVSHRKGRNNSTVASPDDPGSPWAIGAAEGGHKSIHPQLGTMEDFQAFIAKARQHGIEVAIDIAFQCSPDHPYLKEHPEWFLWRPDGKVQYAENPPKKYEDIVPFHFETPQWRELWEELKSIITFWMSNGVRIFRVDNPHTKPFALWEWIIAEARKVSPDVIFLAEAFTRPKVMHRLAKLGFSQSYTYFSWRTTKEELETYLMELTRGEAREFFRPNFWPNTPDILTEYLQYGGEPAFKIRLVLAATLSASYGVYGPPYELCLSEAAPGKEEYIDNEKYEIKEWDVQKGRALRELMTEVNRLRKEHACLQRTDNVTFYRSDNENIIWYRKALGDDILFIAVNLDPFRSHRGRLQVPIEEFSIAPGQHYLVQDVLNKDRFIWQGEVVTIELDPRTQPARIFRICAPMRRELDFDYFY
ncbi:alpha-1,4-glucan--maltose-1-phosphate maltosyltransferase [Geomonas sp. RF6]|uniref:alpha-1,4-glucan--maltose-1-phosphate maltosyltransferase n=1 Tax=Geomonas sp. RF6 TaxID=2897342 RepID=UPI001E396150|nr:alpha-1,4-glucan--maltose-1-phosphate maltosyltransferase [Geomonas sp. RF6]UFS69218.1 alpha-1,4-glucan--maltose-1-phosphate maltosyltransferase [Geomonas sp. RF6]